MESRFFSQHLQPKDLERFSFLESKLGQLKEAQATSTFDCIVSPANSYGIMDGGLATTSLLTYLPPPSFV